MISLYRCDQYEEERVMGALRRSIAALGGWESYLNPGDTVLLKLNLVMNKRPEAAATTHPVFVKALIRLLQEYGCRVVIGDSPGGLFNGAALGRIYRGTGIEAIAEETGAILNQNTGSMDVQNPDGRVMKSLTMTAMLGDVDKVISVSKLKTHGMMTFTGAVKNMFGVIPGTMKAEYHVRMPQADDFADALLDICHATAPVLSFMDGIIGMEGNGPTGGRPRAVGAVLASSNPYQLDLAACSLIGLSMEQVPTLRRAHARGWIPSSAGELEWSGDPREEFYVADFKLPDHIDSDLIGKNLPSFLAKPVNALLRPKVTFHHDICVGCGACAANCPAKVITMKDHRPYADYSRCIRCYCCQELCPKNAVSVRESKLFKLVRRW